MISKEKIIGYILYSLVIITGLFDAISTYIFSHELALLEGNVFANFVHNYWGLMLIKFALILGLCCYHYIITFRFKHYHPNIFLITLSLLLIIIFQVLAGIHNFTKAPTAVEQISQIRQDYQEQGLSDTQINNVLKKEYEPLRKSSNKLTLYGIIALWIYVIIFYINWYLWENLTGVFKNG